MPAQVTITGPDGKTEILRSFAFPPDLVELWATRRLQWEPGCTLSAKAILDEFCRPSHRVRFNKLQESGFTLEGSSGVLLSEMGEDGSYWLDPICCIGIWQDGLNDDVWADFVGKFRRSLQEDIARGLA